MTAFIPSFLRVFTVGHLQRRQHLSLRRKLREREWQVQGLWQAGETSPPRPQREREAPLLLRLHVPLRSCEPRAAWEGLSRGLRGVCTESNRDFAGSVFARSVFARSVFARSVCAQA